MKAILLCVGAVVLSGCATRVNEYTVYAEQTAKIVQSSNISEAACFLVLAEGVKSADNSAKTAISTQIERCRKEPPKLEAPKKNWLGL